MKDELLWWWSRTKAWYLADPERALAVLLIGIYIGSLF